jgi:RNA-directed DNA polymerase
VEEKVSDGRVIEMLRQYLKQDVMDGMESWTPEGGTPQGAIVSPLLSNIYLDPLDHKMAREGHEMVRYADDCAPRAQRGPKGPRSVQLFN